VTWQGVIDAWVAELTANVPGLTEAKVHRYASWSVEALSAAAGERHLAVWPATEGQAETRGQLLTTPSSNLVQSYVVLVWEDATADSSRRMDDEAANLDWLELHEAIRARFMLIDNARLGDPKLTGTEYQGAEFGLESGKRILALGFQTERGVNHT
jgi:hypothetical protein